MEFVFVLLSPPLVWSTPLGLHGQCGIFMHQHSTSRRRRRRRRWHSTYWHRTQCEGVGWLLWWFALMIEICDIRERNVTIKSEIWTTNICFLGFHDIRQWMMLWRLILRSLGVCNWDGSWLSSKGRTTSCCEFTYVSLTWSPGICARPPSWKRTRNRGKRKKESKLNH